MNAQTEQLYDIYGPLHIPFWQTPFFYWVCVLVIAFVALVALFAVVRWYKKRKKALLTPWQRALDECAALQPDAVASKQQAKEFYGQLTTILKRYIQERYNVNTTASTDTELITYLERSAVIPARIIDALTLCMIDALHVKFADAAAVEEHARRDLRLCVECIQNTVPQDRKAS